MSQNDAISETSAERVRCALDLLDRGCVLIPLLKDSKRPAARGWQRTKSVEREEVEQFAARGNYGILTGPASGLIVVDVDPRNGGAVPSDAPPTWTVETPSGGWHYYFQVPDPCPPKDNRGKLGKGLDLQSAGSYVVGPGCRWDGLDTDGTVKLPGGGGYRWAKGRRPADLPLAAFPSAWLSKFVSTRKVPTMRTRKTDDTGSAYGRAALERETATVRQAPEGSRNDSLNRSAFNLGQLAAGGMLAEASAEAELLEAATAVGLPETEARGTIRSGMRAGAAEPRGVPERQHRQATARPPGEVPPPSDADASPEVSGGREAPTFRARFTDPGILYPDVLPPVDWEWPGLAAHGEIVVFSAAQGTGKSWLGYSAALAGAGCLPLWEEFAVPGTRRVLLIDEEKAWKFSQQRITLLCKGLNIRREHWLDAIAPNLKITNRQGFNLDKTDEQGFLDRRDELWRIVGDFKPDWIILDSLTCLHEREENDNGQMHRFFQEHIKPLTTSGATVFTSHHHRKSSAGQKASAADMRGASAIAAAVDSHMTLTKGLDITEVVLRHEKASLAETRVPFTLKRESVLPEDPDAWTYDSIGRPVAIGVRFRYFSDVREDDPQQDENCRAGVERVLRAAGGEGITTKAMQAALAPRWKPRTVRTYADELLTAGLARKAPDLTAGGQGAATAVRWWWAGAWRAAE